MHAPVQNPGKPRRIAAHVLTDSALLVWGALVLRDARVLTLFGLRRGAGAEHFSANNGADAA
jgi:hypothetical protein